MRFLLRRKKKLAKKRVILIFPAALTEEALVYKLVRDYQLAINILRAKITPGEEGRLVMEISNSTEKAIERGLDYLRSHGVLVEELGHEIRIDQDSCIDCGACTGVCLSDALSISAPDWKLKFDKEKCILCELCVSACPTRSIKVVF
jgi:ferredoxin